MQKRIHWSEAEYLTLFRQMSLGEPLCSLDGKQLPSVEQLEQFNWIQMLLPPQRRRTLLRPDLQRIGKYYCAWTSGSKDWMPNTPGGKLGVKLNPREAYEARSEALKIARGLLRTALESGPVRYSVLADQAIALGISIEALKEAKRIMKVTSKKHLATAGFGAGFYTWALPEPAEPPNPVEKEPDSYAAQGQIRHEINVLNILVSKMRSGINVNFDDLYGRVKAIEHALGELFVRAKEGPSLIVSDGKFRHSYTQEEIRFFIRDEIGKAFGETPSPAVAAPVVVVPKAAEPVIVPEKKEEIPSTAVADNRIKVFVYGLNANQLVKISQQVSVRVKVEGTAKFNQSARDKAKNSDLVFLSRFCTHTIHDAFSADCGSKRVIFCSGGTTMVRNRILEETDKLVGLTKTQ